MWTYIWLGVIAVAVFTEAVTSELVSVWFIAGGIVALIASLLGASWYITVPLFIAVSVISMIVFRKIVIKYFRKSEIKTNAESVIGKDYELLTDISFNNAGTIKVNDVIWNVVTDNEKDEVKAGTIVTVKEIKGNKYIVAVKENEEKEKKEIN